MPLEPFPTPQCCVTRGLEPFFEAAIKLVLVHATARPGNCTPIVIQAEVTFWVLAYQGYVELLVFAFPPLIVQLAPVLKFPELAEAEGARATDPAMPTANDIAPTESPARTFRRCFIEQTLGIDLRRVNSFLLIASADARRSLVGAPGKVNF
jgi:hypothetical protein